MRSRFVATRAVLQPRPGSTSPAVRGRSGAVAVHLSRDPGPALWHAWDDLVDRTPGTDVTQLSAWGRLRRHSGFVPLLLHATRDDELVGGALVLVRRLPLVGRVGYLAYGPLADPDEPACSQARDALNTALVELGRNRLGMLFVQPAEGSEHVGAALLERGFRPSTAGIAPAGSVRIDLSADLETIRRGFGKRLRSWPGRWEQRGVRVRRGDERDLPLLCRLMAATAAAHGYPVLPPRYVEALWCALAPTGHAVLFVGEVHGVPVAADLMTRCGDMLRGRLNGFDRTAEAARLSVPAAIRWHMIGWGKAAGYRWFDFGGLRPETLDVLMAGGEKPEQGWPAVDQPKLTFGGTPFRYPQAVEMIASPAVRAGYDLVQRSEAGRRAVETARVLLRGRWAGTGASAARDGNSA